MLQSAVRINKCLASKLLNAPFDNVLLQTIFPVQFLLTLIGNALTVSVLLSAQMKNRANHLLAALSATDMAVFIVMVPSWLASYSTFYNSNGFRTMLGTIKIQIGAMANWFSCAAIWFVLAISIERVLIIKFPFRSLRPYRVRSTVFVVVMNLLITFLLTHHHSVSRKCVMIKMCNNGSEYTEVYALCLPRSFNNWSTYDPSWKKPSKMLELYVEVGTICNAVVGVICPVFTVALLNIFLVNLLQKSQLTSLSVISGKQNPQIQEKRITKTMLAVVTCFTVTNVPSAFLFLYETFFYDPSTRVSAAFSMAASISNFLVLTGKSLNIILLCLCSNTFWDRCKETIHSCVQLSAIRRNDNGYPATKLAFSMSTHKSLSPEDYSVPIRRFNTQHDTITTENIPLLHLISTVPSETGSIT